MKLTLQTQLFPDEKQAELLKDTIRNFNAACNWLAEKAFEMHVANKVKLQQQFYYDIRSKFSVSAQMAAICIRHVGATYSRDKKIKPTFREFAAMPYDSRIYSFKGVDKVSLLTLEGRVVIPFVMGKYQSERFSNAKGQADLVFRIRDNKWFFLVTIDIPDSAEIPVTDFIGIDCGISNLIVTSDGDFESGDDVKRISKKYAALRQVLSHKASKQSQSGKRPRNIHKFFKRISKKVRNFKAHTNHVISKKIVELSIGTRKGIALEDLTGIRQRCEKGHRKAQRSIFSGWSFAELREYITYKAKLSGVPIVLVNPKYTSQQCSECGHTEKANRISQSEFICRSCDLHILADYNASLNIRSRALSKYAQVSERLEDGFSVITGTKPLPNS
jgi:IS605 OrfB family transposase